MADDHKTLAERLRALAVFLESERAALPYGYFARNLPAHMPALGEAIDVISALEGPSL